MMTVMAVMAVMEMNAVIALTAVNAVISFVMESGGGSSVRVGVSDDDDDVVVLLFFSRCFSCSCSCCCCSFCSMVGGAVVSIDVTVSAVCRLDATTTRTGKPAAV